MCHNREEKKQGCFWSVFYTWESRPVTQTLLVPIPGRKMPIVNYMSWALGGTLPLPPLEFKIWVYNEIIRTRQLVPGLRQISLTCNWPQFNPWHPQSTARRKYWALSGVTQPLLISPSLSSSTSLIIIVFLYHPWPNTQNAQWPCFACSGPHFDSLYHTHTHNAALEDSKRHYRLWTAFWSLALTIQPPGQESGTGPLYPVPFPSTTNKDFSWGLRKNTVFTCPSYHQHREGSAYQSIHL